MSGFLKDEKLRFVWNISGFNTDIAGNIGAEDCGEFTLKPSSAIMAPSFLRFQNEYGG